MKSRVCVSRKHMRGLNDPMSGAKKKQERRGLQMDLGMTEKQKQDLKAQKAKRRNTILAIVGGVVAVALVVALLVWNSGVISRSTTALTIKDHKLSVVDMDYYYHQAMNSYATNEDYMAQIYAQSGMTYETTFDPSVDPREQYLPDDETKTFHDYFKEQAKTDAANVCALYDAAKAANYTLSEESQSQLDTAKTSLDEQVRQYGYGSRDAFLKAIYGRNMTEGIYFDNVEMATLAYDYQTHVTDGMKDYSDEDLKAYYDANPNSLDSYDYDYVFFDGTVAATTDAEGNTVEATDEQKTAAMDEAEKKADAMLTAVADAKNATPAEGEEPATFSSVATAQGATASVRTGIMGANFATAPYAQWLTDAARKDGDTEKFEVEGSAWYVVQFHKRYLDNDPTADVRHILLSTAMEDDPATEDVNEATQEPTEERIAEVKAQAQAILDEFNAGEKTADAFGALAEEHSADGRDQEGNLQTPGGLYEKIKKGDMVKPFEDWCLDPARKEGDTGLVQTDYGWHVMYFQASNRPAWMDEAEKAKQSADQTSFLEGVKEGYEAVEGSGWADVGLS